MGGKLSKSSEASAPRIDPSPSENDANLHYKSEVMSHEAASHVDSQLQIFDTTLLQRMSRAVSSLSAGDVLRSVSFESLKEITTCFLEMNQEVLKIILECKKDIWKTPELFDLVEEYLENSLQTLDFCTALERCLMRARDSQLIINVALQRLEEEVNYEKTLEDLRLFIADGDPFTEEFFREFHAVYRQQRSMLEKLIMRKRKLDKKVKSVRAWRRVSCVIFAATFASVLICSVVAAVVAAPPVAAALAAASSVPLGSMGRWFDSLLKHYEDALMGEKEIMSSMQVGTFVAIKDLDSIRVMVDQLEIQISYLLHCVDFTSEEEEAVRFGVEEIRRKLGVFMKSIEDLGEQADCCSRDIRRARTVVLQRIIQYPKE